MTDAQTLRTAGRIERARTANLLLDGIASLGRRFFDHTRHGGAVSRFEINPSGRVYFVDGYRGAQIATLHPKASWRGFSEGGTLRQLVEHLSAFVMWGTPIPRHLLGPWPDWMCGGDLWGYGAEMEVVRDIADRLGIRAEAETPAASAETAPAEVVA